MVNYARLKGVGFLCFPYRSFDKKRDSEALIAMDVIVLNVNYRQQDE